MIYRYTQLTSLNFIRVPKDQKGPLDTFWNIRNSDGYILNNDGSKTACVHQWDRFYGELQPWLDITYMKIPGAKNETERYWKDFAIREKRKMEKLKREEEKAAKKLKAKKGNRGK